MRRFLCLATLSLAAAAADTFAADTAQPPAYCDLPLQQHLQASAAAGEEALAEAIRLLILECGGSATDIVSAAIELFPEQAVFIALTALAAAPEQLSAIVEAAVAAAPEQAALIVSAVSAAQPTAAGPSVDDGPASLPNSIGLPAGGSGGGSAGGITASSS